MNVEEHFLAAQTLVTEEVTYSQDEDVYLWNGVGHYWKQMFYVDIEKYQEKLISAKTEEI